jgi:hypothetical protein
MVHSFVTDSSQFQDDSRQRLPRRLVVPDGQRGVRNEVHFSPAATTSTSLSPFSVVVNQTTSPMFGSRPRASHS